MSQRMPAVQRRDSILKVALSLFAEKGFHGVSIDEIARKVNVSPAILYRHFDSKQQLYDTVLQAMSAQRESYVETVVNSSTGFEDVLIGMTQVYIKSVADNPDMLRIELQSLLDGSAATNDFFINRWKSFTDYIEFGLNERMTHDIPNREITIMAAGLMFQGMVREALVQKFLQPHDRLVDLSMEELSQELVALFLRAVGISKSHLSRRAVIKT